MGLTLVIGTCIGWRFMVSESTISVVSSRLY